MVILSELPDENLLEIFKYISSTDLYNLSFVCSKFKEIVDDSNLWIYCDGRSLPNNQDKVNFINERVNKKTKHLLLAADYRATQIISKGFLSKLVKFPLLTVLALESQQLKGDEFPLRCFPPHLEELSLRCTFVTNFIDFFARCDMNLSNLRVLILDRCLWFSAHCLVSISKLPSLQIVSFFLCKQLSDDEISYISLAGRFGFRSLKVLDVRFTSLGDQIVQSFYTHKNLGELYFHSYLNSYHLDCTKREREILLGDEPEEHSYYKKEYDVDDLSFQTMSNVFGNGRRYGQHTVSPVTDDGVTRYQITKASINPYVPPKSILYKRPYGKCKCSNRKKQKIIDINLYDVNQLKALQDKIEALLNREVTGSRFHLELDYPPLLFVTQPLTEMRILENENLVPARWVSPTYLGESSSTIHITINLNSGAHYCISGDGSKRKRKPGEEIKTKRFKFEDAPPGCSKDEETKPAEKNGVEEGTSSKTDAKTQRSYIEINIPRPNANPGGLITENYIRERFPFIEIRPIKFYNHDNSRKVDLSFLSLRGYPEITDLSLRSLMHLNLNLLDVTNTKVTKEGINSFIQFNPDCRVVHETACKCMPLMHF